VTGRATVSRSASRRRWTKLAPIADSEALRAREVLLASATQNAILPPVVRRRARTSRRSARSGGATSARPTAPDVIGDPDRLRVDRRSSAGETIRRRAQLSYLEDDTRPRVHREHDRVLRRQQHYGRQSSSSTPRSSSIPARKAGLVGPNRFRQSTLFRMIVGEESPDDGVVSVPKKRHRHGSARRSTNERPSGAR